LPSFDEAAQREYNSSSYNVTDRETNGNNAGLDKEPLQGESQQTQSDVSGKEHTGWSSIKRNSNTERITFVLGDGRTISTE